MTQEQEEHLQSVKDKFCQDLDKKYRAGQKEHGGNLWDKEGLLDFAIEEVLDLAVYLYTLKAQVMDQLAEFIKAGTELVEAHAKENKELKP